MNHRREFIANFAKTFPFIALSSPTFAKDFLHVEQLFSEGDENSFWNFIRNQYQLSADVINLNNGGVSPQPLPVQFAHIANYKFANEAPSYTMWRKLDKQREPLRERLANLAGVSAEEIAINRNATEGLNSIIFGLDLKKGDEVVLSKYDYPNMLNAWKQRQKRDGIVLRFVEPIMPSESEEDLVNCYIEAFSTKTKVVHITHLVNWNGQILPVRKIAEKAHKNDILVILDAAHSFAQLDFNVSETGADFMATSLHKWLGAPFGSGLLYIRKPLISSVWALLSANEPDGDNIRKFESLGTRSFASEMAIGAAIDFHETIQLKRKQNRLYYLKTFWTEKVNQIPKVTVLTPTSQKYSGALALFSIEGKKANEIEETLLNKYQIHTTSVVWEKLNGVRVTPNVYTTENDLNKLVDAISEIARL